MSFKEVFDWYSKEGYLSSAQQGSLTLYKYTTKCVMEGNWNFHTIQSRGLVLDQDGKIIARPFKKFFNLNERPETRIDVLPPEVPELSIKYDGSLIITFLNPETNQWTACTMGSWDNTQTQYANEWLEKNSSKLDPAYTYLFELIGSWNRIVVSYLETKMILIGIIHTESGDDWDYTKVRAFGLSNGLDAVIFEKKPLTEIDIDDPNVTNEEGFVARYSNGLRVKYKYSQYVTLHKILTGLSIKGIWEFESTSKPMNLSNVPEEFKIWFNIERTKIQEAKKQLEEEAKRAFQSAPICQNRKEYAVYFTQFKGVIPGICFKMLDNQNYDELLWKAVKPSIHRTFQKDEL